MNLPRVDAQLSEALGDRDGAQYTPTLRSEAVIAAVRQYSRYRPLTRRFSTGQVFTAAVAGDTTLNVLGGPFVAGDLIDVETWNAQKETVTVQSADQAVWTPSMTAPVTALALAAPLARNHAAGVPVAKQTPGLQFTQGQDTYQLPPDWVEVDTKSFNVAVGADLQWKREDGFYDGVYPASENLSSMGFGLSQDFAGGRGAWWRRVGYTPAGLVIPEPGPAVTLYRFMEGDPPYLWTSPAPSMSLTADFHYKAVRPVNAVPQGDEDAILDYARYHCYKARAGYYAAQLEFNDTDGVAEKPTSNAGKLMEMAEEALKAFERKIARRPFAVGG